MKSSREGFSANEERCGVDLLTCPAGTRCINGYCKRYEPHSQPLTTDFIILPQT